MAATRLGNQLFCFDEQMWLSDDVSAGLYRGRVTGPESGDCEARIVVSRIAGNCLAIDYEAVGAAGLQHVEHTVVDGPVLYVAHSEAPGVHVFRSRSAGVFDCEANGPYVQRIAASCIGGELVWSWHWAPAGQEPREQSRATVRLADA